MPKPKDVLGLAQDKKAVMVDLKFMDFMGLWQHFSVPISELTESVFDEGLGFDGSSIRGWMPIHASDMLVVPDADTAVMDPFMKDPTLSLICNIVDPITKEQYSRDPRFIAQKAEKYLKSTGIGDVAYFGPEAEFFIFDGVSYDSGPNHGFYKIESREGQWETGSPVEQTFDGKQAGTRPNLGYKPRYKEGYFPVAPTDSLQDIRSEMVLVLEQVGIQVEKQHHEVATAGQAEIDIRFESLLKCADKMTWYKYILKNVALRNGKTVTFMPKPIFGDNGSGMHTHQSIWKGGKPIARPVLQPVPRLLRHVDGGAGRDPEPHRSRRSLGQGHLRPLPRGAEGRPEDARLARGGARRAEGGPRVPAQGRRLHRGRDQHLARLQGGEGVEPGAAAPDADGVRALFRYLSARVARMGMKALIPVLALLAACTPAQVHSRPDPRSLRGVTLGLPVPADARPTPGIGCGQLSQDLPLRAHKALVAAFSDAGASVSNS